jgi:hypothetical protein
VRSGKKASVPFVDYGDIPEVFVDDLTTVEEFGSVTHAVFSALRRTGDELERRASVRLIIPTELRAQIARRLIAGSREVYAPTEIEQVH